MNQNVDVAKLLEATEEELKSRFYKLREKHFNRNTKGYEYEKILKAFLEPYLGGLFDFHIRVPLIDSEMEILSTFSLDENDFDVVCTYKTAIPKIVFKAYETSFLPYDAVAFIVEVKQTLTKTSLEDDLKKLDKLHKLEVGKRFGVHFSTKYSIQRPLRILFYYESDIAEETLLVLQKKYQNAWDFITILMDGTIFGNPSMPIIGERLKTGKIAVAKSHPLLRLMLYTTTSLPCPPIVNTWSLFINLLSTPKD